MTFRRLRAIARNLLYKWCLIMPSILLVTAPIGAQPRLRSEILPKYLKKGYVLDMRRETATWAELFEEALTPSLFAQQRIFEVDDGKSLGKLPDDFKKYIEEGDSDVIFLLFSEKAFQKDLGDVYKRVSIVPYEAAPFWPNQRIGWLQKCAKAKGYSLNSDAAAMLVEWIEDEEELRSELDKLGCAANGKRIDLKLVNDLSIDEGGKEVLNLLDAITNVNVVEVIKNITSLRENGELIPIISALHKRVRNACMVSRLGSDAASSLHLTAFQTKIAKSMVPIYGANLLSLWLGELIRLSWSERNGEGESWEGLEKLLLAVMSRAKKRY